MLNEVIFDVETQRLFSEIEGDDPGKLGISIVSLYHRTLTDDFAENRGRLVSFWESEFDRLWSYLQKADRIIGFNSLHFDVPALSPYAPFDLTKLNHFDIMQKVKENLGKRISLDALSKETLDVEKSDIGVNAVLYWKEGGKENLDKLKKYCEDDVMITRDLYDFGLKNGSLKYTDKWNTQRKIEVDFSYTPEEIEKSQQSALF